MLKKIIGKFKRKNIMTWALIWLNWSVATINTTLQLLDIYRYRYRLLHTNNYVKKKVS